MEPQRVQFLLHIFLNNFIPDLRGLPRLVPLRAAPSDIPLPLLLRAHHVPHVFLRLALPRQVPGSRQNRFGAARLHGERQIKALYAVSKMLKWA